MEDLAQIGEIRKRSVIHLLHNNPHFKFYGNAKIYYENCKEEMSKASTDIKKTHH
uniref:Myosin motor domain-containing protein n=1 Tax=Heterorhabditis bacteriophora TaxID=37862 RepID=A0A1I7XB35_HETBA